MRIVLTPLSKPYACSQVMQAPEGYICRIHEPKRSEEQSAKFHAMCGEVSRQLEYMGKKLTQYQWKVLFVSGHAIATGLGAEVVPGLEGEFVNIRESTASMPVSRTSSLIEYVHAYCADKGVVWSDPMEVA
jgi:hypothetical protein